MENKLDGNILITGASGYIGGTFTLYLKSQGYQPICIDNFNQCIYSHLLGLPFYNVDINDQEKLIFIMKKHNIKHVFHFAAFIEVEESVYDPLKYYRNNVSGSISLFECCVKQQIKNIVFSSTACVYSSSDEKLKEDAAKSPENPYGWTKYFVEQILQDLVSSGKINAGICLRYFNVAGSWEGKFGPCKDKQHHLIPIILERIAKNQCVQIFGNDYPTRDGTCIRDYIHISDLCQAHLHSILWADKYGQNKCTSFNIGTGKGCSVQEVVNNCEEIFGKFQWKIGNRRPGDAACSIAAVEKIKQFVGWEAKHGLKEIIQDAYEWSLKSQEFIMNEKKIFDINKMKEFFHAVYDPFNEENSHELKLFFAPGRINIIGEHTDYTKGFVLPTGIKQGVYMIARKNNVNLIRAFAVNDTNGEQRLATIDLKKETQFIKRNNWSDYIFACYFRRQYPEKQTTGIDILVFGDLEQGAGLSSSAAIEMCTMVMLLKLNELPIPEAGTKEMVDLSLSAQYAENHYVGVMSGIMDQFASGNAKENSAILLNCLNLESKFVKLELEGYKFILANTNKPRKLIESKYNERVQECKKGLELINKYQKEKNQKEFEYLGQIVLDNFTIEMQDFIKSQDDIVYKRVMHVINENNRVIKLFNLLSQKDQIIQIGQLINESGDSLKTLFEVTGEHLDALVESARKQKGVVGSRMVGAGFGGCTLNLIKNQEDIIQEFKKNVSQDYSQKMNIVPGFIEVEIGHGAKELNFN